MSVYLCLFHCVLLLFGRVFLSYHGTWGSWLSRRSIQTLLTLTESHRYKGYWTLIFFKAPLKLDFSISHLLQDQGSLLNLEVRAFQGVPGHLQAPSCLWDLPDREPPETGRDQSDHLRLGAITCCYLRTCFSLSPSLLSDLPFLPSLLSPGGPEGQDFETFQPESVIQMHRCAHTHKKIPSTTSYQNRIF